MESSFEALNQILRKEHLTIDKYQQYIDALPGSPLRNHLVAMLTHHKEHATRIAYFIQTNGGHVDKGSGWAGWLAAWPTRLTHFGENEPLNMLDELYKSESEGLKAARETAELYLCGSEKEMLAPMWLDEEGHLRQLERLKEDLLQ